jgi:alkyl sulfatase BDS1-like metallo-beta-lactamase superfamily hydrolase
MALAADYGADHLIPAYGSCVSGADVIRTRLVEQQKLAQYLIDETHRLVFAGASSHEIAEQLTIPAELQRKVQYSDLHHRVPWIVRSLISRNFGWFSGDPLDYVRHPATERARRLAQELGGLDELIARSRSAYLSGDFPWAAELATEALLLDPGNARAKEVRSASFQAIAFASDSSNERNVLLTSVAMETGPLRRELIFELSRHALSALSFLREPGALLDLMGPKLACNRVRAERLWVEFRLVDRSEVLDIAVVDGVMLRGRDLDRSAPDLRLALTYPVMTRGVEGAVSFDDLLASGDLEIVAGQEHWSGFISSFDW